MKNKPNRLTQNYLIQDVAYQTGLPVTDVRKVINAYMQTVRAGLLKGRSVTLTGIGSLSLDALKGRRMKLANGSVIDVPARSRIKFRCSEPLKREARAIVPKEVS